MLLYERTAWENGRQCVAGVDEAGRGPLAGPVVAAAVCFSVEYAKTAQDHDLAQLTDSKALTARQRDHFYDVLTQSSDTVTYAIAVVGEEDIEHRNILRATHLAMQRALRELSPAPDWALVDGRPVPDLPCTGCFIVKGDQKSLSIAAASVLAKVSRDRIMLELDRRYPQYGFAQHKGYGTRQHLDALRVYGPAPCHRRSFAPVRDWKNLIPNKPTQQRIPYDRSNEAVTSA